MIQKGYLSGEVKGSANATNEDGDFDVESMMTK